MDLEKAKIFAERIACRAGKLLLEYSSKIKILEWKDRQDVATNADIESEKLILSAIEKEYPGHSILSEEKGEINKDSEYQWLVDPLDGTKEYLRGLPLYNVSLCLKDKDEVILAIVFRPSDQQLFSAARKLGAFLNKKPIIVSPEGRLGDSFIYGVLPRYLKIKDRFDDSWEKLGRLAKKVYRLRALADENTILCWVALGGCEGYVNIEDKPKIWDVQSGLFIAQEAGAVATDLSGKPLTENFENGIIVSNGKIHKELLGVINDQFD